MNYPSSLTMYNSLCLLCVSFVWLKMERIKLTAFCMLQKEIFNILRASCGYTDE